MTDEPVADPTRGGWFQGGTIVKELKIFNPAEEDQDSGVILQEIVARMGLTELGHSKSASPVGVDGRFFFDSGTHRWMYQQLSDAPNRSAPATSPAEVLKRTMGGLPVFWGAERHGAEQIVPMDASHLLAISTMDVGGSESHVYLAATVAATNPEAGKRASEKVQREAIRREGIKLGAIGESLGDWYKDGEHVYNSQAEVIVGADPKTFAPLSKNWPGSSFATDQKRVYGRDGVPIPGADPKTFELTGQLTAKDARHTYDWSSGSLKIESVTGRE